ncbi:ABC transporter ATP-binding protein [Bosea sp. (in: a-proteobacteria)]|uniref:ABC transporter ATP-binding protein n=1 Tax=Bosea sp. (in: a-proteobacteria) TaxID=1871050 RepID=UPI002601C2B4|nr:ABC transporter ATP-binding protein [Bosea sp. (in: a-proteobacteria)]MCO5091015.1 ABC transporter ATP-binding protein [Bosea sp. (in: a-proteobacteria)]
MLKISNLSVSYGGLRALRDVSIEVRQGEFVSIIGPNGAGKTTLFKTISGVVVPQSGAISFEGRALGRVRASSRPLLGIAHVPEGRQVFKHLTVQENLLVGTEAGGGRGSVEAGLQRALDLFPVLARRSSQLAGTLSGGEQQMLAIGRGLASFPKLLLLDEPTMGLAPAIVDQIFDTLRGLRSQDITLLIVEQRAIEAVENSDRGYVISTGEIVTSGTRDELMRNEQIREAYLGT